MSGQEKNKKSVTWEYDLPTFMCVESSMPSPTRVTLASERKGDRKQEDQDEDDDGSPKPMDISGGGVD
jgi:hypothetical protein